MKTEPSSWTGLWWRDQLSHQQDAKFWKNIFYSAEIESVWLLLKGEKMAVCFRDNLFDKSLCLAVKENAWDRMHTGHATMALNVCQGNEEDSSRPSIASHSWAGQQQLEEVQCLRPFSFLCLSSKWSTEFWQTWSASSFLFLSIRCWSDCPVTWMKRNVQR